MSENNNKMTSIARRINFDFWLKQFANFLMIDVVLVVLIAVTFFVWRENASARRSRGGRQILYG